MADSGLTARSNRLGVYWKRVVNLGVTAQRISGAISLIDTTSHLPHDANVVVIELGGIEVLRREPSEAIDVDMRQLFSTIRKRWPAACLILVEPNAPRLGQMYSSAIATVFSRLASDHDAILIPDFFDRAYSDPAYVASDGMHLSPDGYRLLASNVIEAIGQCP